MPGFDTSRFIETPASEFVCLICHDVLCQPVILLECEHIFCHDCLSDWLSASRKSKNIEENGNITDSGTVMKYSGICPVDRTVVNTNELLPPQRVFRNLLSALHIRCSYAPSCDLSVQICELEHHETNCPHNPNNANRLIDCPKKCGANIRLILASEHDCVEYLKNRLKICENKCSQQTQEINDLIQEKQSLIETIQNDTDKYELKIEKLRKEVDKQKKYYQNELSKLRSALPNYDKIVKGIGNGTSSLHLPQLQANKPKIVNVTLNVTSNNASASKIIRKSSLDEQTSSVSDAFSILDSIHSELPPPLTPSKVSFNNESSSGLNKIHSESIPNLSTNSEISNHSEPSSPCNSPSPSSSGVVRNAKKMFNKLPTMIPYINPPSQISQLIPSESSTLSLATVDLTEYVRRSCRHEKIVQVMSLVDRRHFYPTNEFYKCLKLKHGAHSFKLVHELRLLEIIESLINGESRILDIGSGHGFLTVCLAQIAKYVLGVEHIKELHLKSVEIVKKYYAHLLESNRISFVRNDGRKKCWSDKFDLILVEAIVKNDLPPIYLRSLRPRGCVIAVFKVNSRLQLCRVTLDSQDRPTTSILSNDHDNLSQQYRDTLCDIRNQETSFLNRFK